MPRDGSGVFYHTTGAFVGGTTIVAASMNSKISEITADLNAARPISVGGTGATSASGARSNLGLGTMALEAAADYALLAGATFTGAVIVPDATEDTHALNRQTADARYLAEENNWAHASDDEWDDGGTTRTTNLGASKTAFVYEASVTFETDAGFNLSDMVINFCTAADAGGTKTAYDIFDGYSGDGVDPSTTAADIMFIRIQGWRLSSTHSTHGTDKRTYCKIEIMFADGSGSGQDGYSTIGPVNFFVGADTLSIQIDTVDANDEFNTGWSNIVRLWERD